MEQLETKTRMDLMKFVCSFAWTDLKVTDQERAVIGHMIEGHGFGADERHTIEEWLQVPPRPEEVDPRQISREHRQMFLDAAEEVVESDGVTFAEQDALLLFRELLD